MNLHSCQSTNGEKRLPIANIKKACVPCSLQRRQSLRSPLNRTRDRNVQIFSFSTCQIPGSLFFMWGVAHTRFAPVFSLLSLNFPQHFCSFSGLRFLQPHSPHFQIPSRPSGHSAYLGFFHFHDHRALASLPLPTLLFSPFTPTSLPGQPGTGALGDPSTFQREEMTVFWWWICWLPIAPQAAFPLHCSASCQAQICIFWGCIDRKTSNIFCGMEP